MNQLPISLCWLDIETTGLDPHTDLLLEVGIILTDKDLTERFRANIQLEHGAALPAKIAELYQGNRYVYDMHKENGLWNELLTPGDRVAPQALDTALADTAAHFTPGRKHMPRIAGFNPGFDLGWLRVHAPVFAAALHYGVFDCSTMRQAVTDRYPYGHWGPSDTTAVAHRGLADSESAIAYYRWFRAHVMSPHGLRQLEAK